jgi:hypothetical protein
LRAYIAQVGLCTVARWNWFAQSLRR